jgi:hypothetical protein
VVSLSGRQLLKKTEVFNQIDCPNGWTWELNWQRASNKPKLTSGLRIEGCFEEKIYKVYNSKGEEAIKRGGDEGGQSGRDKN